MKIHPLLILSGALLSLAAVPCSRADNFTEVVINPTAEDSTAQLTLQGLPFSGTGPAPGFTIGYSELSPSSEQSQPLSVGLFRLNRPTGLYQWQFGGASADRLAMELTNDHRLVLHSTAVVDHTPLQEGGPDPDVNTLELLPGPSGGIYLNGHPLVTPLEANLGASLTVGGGKLALGTGFTPYWWQWLFDTPGVMAVGQDARAFGDQAVALGSQTRAGYFSVALGYMATAQFYSTALGANSTAIGRATAIAGGYANGQGAVAIGPSSYASSEWCTAVGASAAAVGTYAVGIGGWALVPDSFAGAWGTTLGNASIALGGYTGAGADKSFAANSGVTWGEYSVAIGRGTIAEQKYQVVLGTFNDNQNLPRGSVLQPLDPIFVIGNGHIETVPTYTEVRSNAFMVRYNGDAWVQGGLTVEGGPAGAPATSVFKGDVSVQGVLRVPESGDLSMGAFTTGSQP
jgi:hypothetical protein